MEVRQASGQSVSPEKTGDEELKLIAINSLLHSDTEKALPMLEKFLQGSQPPKLKERALFVLSQSGSPRGREIVAGIARGNANPELQMQALKYLGLFGGKESRQVLADIYGSSTSMDVKKAILRSFMVAGERERLFAAAKGEAVPELRREAIRQLGVMGAQAEIWQLYQSETRLRTRRSLSAPCSSVAMPKNYWSWREPKRMPACVVLPFAIWALWVSPRAGKPW